MKADILVLTGQFFHQLKFLRNLPITSIYENSKEATAMTIASVSKELQEFSINPDGSAATPRTSISLVSGQSSQELRSKDGETGQQKPKDDNSKENLKNVTEALDSYMESRGVDLKFQVDDRTDIVQVVVRDPNTDKVIRKIPADEMLSLAASIDKMAGLLYDKQS